MNPTFAAIPIVLALAVGGSAAAVGPIPANYSLFAIKTDLLRRLLFSSNADAYLVFDVAEAVHDKKFEQDRIDKETFTRALAAMARQTGQAKPGLNLCFRYAGASWDLDPKEKERMEAAIKALCRQAGFAKLESSMSGEGEFVARQDGEVRAASGRRSASGAPD